MWRTNLKKLSNTVRLVSQSEVKQEFNICLTQNVNFIPAFTGCHKKMPALHVVILFTGSVHSFAFIKARLPSKLHIFYPFLYIFILV